MNRWFLKKGSVLAMAGRKAAFSVHERGEVISALWTFVRCVWYDNGNMELTVPERGCRGPFQGQEAIDGKEEKDAVCVSGVWL